jgi:FXSXX-COOH protein
MDDNLSEQDAQTPRDSILPDVAQMPLRELFASEDTALAAAVRRVAEEIEQSVQAIAGWSSYIDGPSERS